MRRAGVGVIAGAVIGGRRMFAPLRSPARAGGVAARRVPVRALTIVGSAVLILAAATAAVADKKGPRPTVSSPTDCAGWDCEGGIICSCCFDDGCYICDAHTYPGTDITIPGFQCHWENALRSGAGTVRPGGGVIGPIERAPVTRVPRRTVPGGAIAP